MSSAARRHTAPGSRHLEVLRGDRPVDLWSIARQTTDAHVALLDNGCPGGSLGHWSLLGAFPRREIFATGDTGRPANVFGGPIGEPKPLGADPLAALRNFANELSCVDGSALGAGRPPLTHGAIGYLGYELLHASEGVAPADKPSGPGRLMHFVEYAVIVAVDHHSGRHFICATGSTAREAEALVERAQDLVAAAPERVDPVIAPRGDGRMSVAEFEAVGLAPVTDPDRYLELVANAREQICAGRVYEVCLTHEFRGCTELPGDRLYDALRMVSPSPMAAYLRNGDLEVLCSSPERFLSGDARGRLETRPIKGTRARSSDPVTDARLREALLASAKDRAENTMIVDLARNDLGRVCDYGSVEVAGLCEVESYATVHHLVSTVRGRMRHGLHATDAIRAAFPGGSMTGAPKIEATRLIAELECSRRGVYSGAIGWLGGDGAFDLNIAIRTIVKQGPDVSFHTGGAITADSDPKDEFDESMVKVRALVDALTQPGTATSMAGAGVS